MSRTLRRHLRGIDDAYNRYSVLVFRDQTLTPEQQIAFARRFGDLEISPRTQFALPGHPEILVLSNIIENGKPIGNADAGPHLAHRHVLHQDAAARVAALRP